MLTWSEKNLHFQGNRRFNIKVIATVYIKQHSKVLGVSLACQWRGFEPQLRILGDCSMQISDLGISESKNFSGFGR